MYFTQSVSFYTGCKFLSVILQTVRNSTHSYLLQIYVVLWQQKNTQIYALLSAKVADLKICDCKKDDKYDHMRHARGMHGSIVLIIIIIIHPNHHHHHGQGRWRRTASRFGRQMWISLLGRTPMYLRLDKNDGFSQKKSVLVPQRSSI